MFYYQLPNGGWDYFGQHEGLPQGCSFSLIFTALVPNKIISKLDEKLRKRAKERKHKAILFDDKEGGLTNLLAYVDDLNVVVPHEDCLFICQELKRLADEIGLQINPEKLKSLHQPMATHH